VVKATIYDVAKLAGVAPSTVSRAFSRPGRVSSRTAERIREAADELGYRRGRIPRDEATRGTRVLALVVADIGNPFFLPIIRGAEQAAAEAGFVTVVVDSREDGAAEESALERVLPMVDGLVLASSRLPDTAIRRASRQRPVVVLNRVVSDVPSIVPDHARGARQAMTHLSELGHRRIVYVSGPEASWADGTRWRALLEAGQDHEFRVRRMGPYSPTIEGGIQAARELTRADCTAVIAYNDQLALGLVAALQRSGVRVPEDLSVVGFDNVVVGDLVEPGLTTVAAPLRELGAGAVATLLALVGPTPGVAERPPMLLPTRLVVRGSTSQRNRNSTSPASGTTRASGFDSNDATSTSDGSR
jgi:LacI family repressor for deo operon, udp, cdd, tsx, nupC, and nupG